MAEAASSTSVNVTWSPPSMPNGIITRYQVTYTRNDVMNAANTSGPATMIQLSGLEKFTNYTIAVRGFTDALGEESDPVSVRTNEDGKLYLFSDCMIHCQGTSKVFFMIEVVIEESWHLYNTTSVNLENNDTLTSIPKGHSILVRTTFVTAIVNIEVWIQWNGGMVGWWNGFFSICLCFFLS